MSIAEGRVRLPPDERRRQIVDQAIVLVAEVGFEGLTTRQVALAVGINSATLHHHFPVKDDLVGAMGQELARRFRAEKTATGSDTDDPVAGLARQISDALNYRVNDPTLPAVYAELVNRARRDERVARIVEVLDAGWLQDIRVTLIRGVDTGVLRGDVDVDGMALVVLHGLRGAMFDPLLTAAAFGSMCDALIALIVRAAPRNAPL